MELAFQYRSNGPRSDAHDLVLLDTTTGDRRPLVEGVAWGSPRWSADGRRVRFEQRLPRGFVLRELDLESGAIADVEADTVDVSSLPGDGDCAARSPFGRWIVYRHRSTMLCVARADGSEVFLVKLPFPYFTADAHWSPCGTRLAAHLTADRQTGVYVIDLRTGEHQRIVSGEGYHPTGWSPDGSWIVATKTYDYEWLELWLLAPDGSTTRRLTDDGRCRNAAIRPAGAAPVDNGEHELTFAWAQPLRSAADRPAAGEALSAHVRIDLRAGPPFAIMLVVRTNEGLQYPVLTGCANIPDGFAKLDAFLNDHDYRPADGFTVVFPRFATDDPAEELTLLEIAHLILAEANTRLWRFDRDLQP